MNCSVKQHFLDVLVSACSEVPEICFLNRPSWPSTTQGRFSKFMDLQKKQPQTSIVMEFHDMGEQFKPSLDLIVKCVALYVVLVNLWLRGYAPIAACLYPYIHIVGQFHRQRCAQDGLIEGRLRTTHAQVPPSPSPLAEGDLALKL